MSQRLLTADQLKQDDRLILVQQEQILVQGDKYLFSPAEMFAQGLELDLLIIENGERRLLVADIMASAVVPASLEQISLRGLLFRSEQALATAGKANQILHWYRSHRYCGFCGRPTVFGAEQLAVHCAGCNHHFFPRINPCVIMLVVRGREILLARNARYRSGFFSCLAGFIEVGETAEETVAREVREESGLEVQNIRYFKSQSWPFPSQLMLAYFADYESGDIVPEPAEIEEADWYDVDDLPNVPAANISVAGELIHHYVEQVKSGRL